MGEIKDEELPPPSACMCNTYTSCIHYKHHSCAECLDSGTARNHICCYNWYLNTGIKSEFLEQNEDAA